MYLGVYVTPESKALYHETIAQWEATGRRLPDLLETSARYTAHDGVTVTVLVGRYWKHAKDRYRKSDGSYSTALTNVKPALRAVRVLYLPVRLCRPDRPDTAVPTLFGKKGKKLEPGWKNRYIGLIKGFTSRELMLWQKVAL